MYDIYIKEGEEMDYISIFNMYYDMRVFYIHNSKQVKGKSTRLIFTRKEKILAKYDPLFKNDF